MDETWPGFQLIASIVEDSHENLDAGFKDLLEDRYGQAIAHFNRMERTKRSFIEILKQQRHIPNPFNTMGVRLRRAGDYPGAIYAYNQALSAAPDDPHVHYNLARAFASDLDHHAALERLKAAL